MHLRHQDQKGNYFVLNTLFFFQYWYFNLQYSSNLARLNAFYEQFKQVLPFQRGCLSVICFSSRALSYVIVATGDKDTVLTPQRL